MVLLPEARQGTSAANFPKNSNGESLMPMVPSDHGLVNMYTRSPWVSSPSCSSDITPFLV
jgi:hypothetical protein